MNKSTLLIAVLMLAVGVGAGYWLFGGDAAPPVGASEPREPLFYRNPMNPNVTSPVPAQDSMGMDYIPVYAEQDNPSTARKILFYRNPMNPDVTSPTPAKDSMGMDYVPVYADNQAGVVAGTVSIDPVVVQNIGVRTSMAMQKSISRNIRAVGRVDFDEERMTRLHPKVEGWIEEIRVDKTGQDVKVDEILLSIYSPKLVATQQEYLLALNNLSALQQSSVDEIRQGAEDLVNSSRQRLELLDVPEHQIAELEKTREIKKSLHIHSQVAGTVIRIGARQGQFVTPKTELYMMVNLDQVWAYADVYEYELPWVNIGDQVEMTLASVPGKTFKGALTYIYPYAEAKTRTTKVRMVFDNRQRLLRPDMFAEISISSNTLQNAVVIPAEAIIRSGTRTQVFVVRGPGKYEPRLVTLGIESAGQVAILDGVQPGEVVVTSAQFLIDSESKLREATAKMMESLGGDENRNEPGDMGQGKTPEAAIDKTMDNIDRTTDKKSGQRMDTMRDMPGHEHGHQHDPQGSLASPQPAPGGAHVHD